LILMPVARNAGGALCAGRGYRAERAGGGPTGVSDKMQARASEFLEHHDHRPCPCHKNATTNTPGTTNHTRGAREGAQRGSRGAGTLCPSAPFTKPRSPEESPRTALSSHQCLML